MKTWLAIMTLLFFAGVMTSELLAASARESYRGDRTYVQPHLRSYPGGNPYNNYGLPGNYNPHTGRFTPGDPGDYLDRYYGIPRGSRSVDPYQDPYSR